jgi:hypothetical protein
MLFDDPFDPALADVVDWFLGRKGDLVARFRGVVRRGIDEVIDGGRTGRWSVDQLAKTEKTYIGTKIEHLVVDEFELPRGQLLDAKIADHEVDIKWSLFSQWEIPVEAVNQLCLVLGANEKRHEFHVGLARCHPEHLGAPNRDRKRKLTATRYPSIRWLVPTSPLPPNFFATVPSGILGQIMGQPKGQARVRALFELQPRRAIPREAVETVAQQKDPMRRIRADKGARMGSVVVLSARYKGDLIRRLGLDPIPAEHLISVPITDAEAVGGDALES